MLIVATALFLTIAGVLGKRRFVEAVLLTRSVCDPVFELSKSAFGRADIGLGASLNLAMIVIALAFVITQPRVRTAPALSAWLPFLLAAAVAVPVAPEPVAALRLFLVLISHAALFILPFYLVTGAADFRRYAGIIVIGSIVPTLIALAQLSFGWAETDGGTRVFATFGHPNVFAFYLLMILALVLALLGTRSVQIPQRWRLWLTLYVPLLLSLIVLTKTRSGWAGAAIIIGIYALRFDRRYLLYILATPLLPLLVPSIADRLADLQQGSYNEGYAKLNSYAWRELLWESALVWVNEKPFRGHGLEAFAFHVTEFFPLPLPDGTIDSHSVFMQLLFEAGLIGLVAYVWLLLRITYMICPALRKGDAMGWMLIAMLLAYSLMAYSDNMLYYLTPNWYFWFALGSACAVVRIHHGRASGSCGPGISRPFVAFASEQLR